MLHRNILHFAHIILLENLYSQRYTIEHIDELGDVSSTRFRSSTCAATDEMGPDIIDPAVLAFIKDQGLYMFADDCPE